MNKEILLAERERILKNIENRHLRIAKIDELIKELENKKWKPAYDEYYYYITKFGDVGGTKNLSWNSDEQTLPIGNYFKTREEAEFEVERLKVLEELKEFSYEFSDEEWKKTSDKYNIYYDCKELRIGCSSNCNWKQDLIYFKTKDDVQKVIDKIGKERLKKYYFNVGNE